MDSGRGLPLPKSDRIETSLQKSHDGELEASVFEGVVGVPCLLLLGGQELTIHLLQWVVDIGPIQMPAPLCSGAEQQRHVHRGADQQKENQGQGKGQPGGPGGRRETPNGGCWLI